MGWMPFFVLSCYPLKEVVDMSSWGRDHWEGLRLGVNYDTDGGVVGLYSRSVRK